MKNLIEIGKDAYKIPGDCNVYLLLTPEPCVIDTGQPREREKIKEAIETIIPLEEIKYVYLTHLHFDHCGNVNLFNKARFFCSKHEIEDMKENPENFFFGNMPTELEPILMHKLEEIPKEHNGLKLVEVPGHTKGSISLIDEKRKLLFSGDTIFKNGIGRTDFQNSQPEKMRESINKLLTLLQTKKLQLMPGHDY